MQGSKQFERAILKNLLLWLRRVGVVGSRGMSFHDRKNAVRHAADAALATARGTAPCWSRSLAAELSHGLDAAGCRSRPVTKSTTCKRNLRRSRTTRSLRARPKSKAMTKAGGFQLARSMVRSRTRALREVVPGGRRILGECTLLGEALDYAVSLKAQVEAMQLLVRSLQAPNDNPAPTAMLKNQ